MLCSVPPPLNDNQIGAALEEDADMDVLRHLEMCPHCRQRVEEARSLESALRFQLIRNNCPPPQALSDYHFEILEPIKVTYIQDHLSQCSCCQEELDQLVQFLNTEETLPSKAIEERRGILSKLSDIIAQFIPPNPELVYRGGHGLAGRPIFRGDSPDSLDFEADGVRIMVELRKTDKGYALQGQLLPDDDLGIDWSRAMVEVLSDDAILSVAAIDEVHMFYCELPEKSVLQLRFVSPDGRRILIEEIAFDD